VSIWSDAMKMDAEWLRVWAKLVLQANETDFEWMTAGAQYLVYHYASNMLEDLRNTDSLTDEQKHDCLKFNFIMGKAMGALVRRDREYISKQFLRQIMEGEEIHNKAIDLCSNEMFESFMRGFKGEEEE